MRLPSLDARLQCMLDHVPTCLKAADIGADHGRLSLALLSQGICEQVVVTDISDASLSKARALLQMHGLAQRAKFVVSDGLDALDGREQAICIGGMGGETIAGILRRGAKHAKQARLILSAQTEAFLVRDALQQEGFRILKEPVVRASGRFYTIMVAQSGEERLSEQDLFVGKRLTGSASATVADYLEWRIQVARANKRLAPEKLQWLEEMKLAATEREAGL